MWWAGTEAVDVFLGERHAAVAGLAENAHLEEFDAVGPAWEWAVALIEENSRRSLRRRRARVWLSGALARPFLLEAVEGVRSHEEALQIATALAGERTGLSGEWVVWLDGWRLGMQTLAAAMPRDVKDLVFSTKVSSVLKVVSLRPWWNAVSNAATSLPEPPSLIGIMDGEALTLLGGDSNAFWMASSTDAIDGEQAMSTLARLRVGMADGVAPAHLFLRRGIQTSDMAGAQIPIDIPFGCDGCRAP